MTHLNRQRIEGVGNVDRSDRVCDTCKSDRLGRFSDDPPGEVEPMLREIDAAQLADIEKFEVQLDRYLKGELDDDVFRVFRLNNGIYGQRQGGHNQMVRVKVPYGSIQPDQLEMMADIADEYSRGWGHITTRQNIQFHFVQLETVPAVMRKLASVGMTTREACGDTVRNVQGCH